MSETDGEKLRSEAARAMGQAKTPAKTEAGRENAAKARRARWDLPGARERHAEALREAHRRRREAKEATERAALAVDPKDLTSAPDVSRTAGVGRGNPMHSVEPPIVP